MLVKKYSAINIRYLQIFICPFHEIDRARVSQITMHLVKIIEMFQLINWIVLRAPSLSHMAVVAVVVVEVDVVKWVEGEELIKVFHRRG